MTTRTRSQGLRQGTTKLPRDVGGAGLSQREEQRPWVNSGDLEKSAGHGEEQSARLMKYEANGTPRENEKARRRYKLVTCESRSRESCGPKGAGPPRRSGRSFPDRH